MAIVLSLSVICDVMRVRKDNYGFSVYRLSLLSLRPGTRDAW